MAIAATAFPSPGVQCRSASAGAPRPSAYPQAMLTTEPSCSASTKRRSSGSPARNGTSVLPGLEKIVVSSSRRSTSNVASRTVGTHAGISRRTYNCVCRCSTRSTSTTVEQADALLKPKRVEILRHLAEPTTCTQIGGALGETPQAIYYHVKRLQAAGLVSLVDERRVRGIAEGIYQAVARSFWVSPACVGRLGPERAREEHARPRLPAQPDRADVARPRDAGHGRRSRCPRSGSRATSRSHPRTARRSSPSCSGRSARCCRKYGGGEGHTFRLALACYPHQPWLGRGHLLRLFGGERQVGLAHALDVRGPGRPPPSPRAP